jgi:quinol-cytochrome oxidoreductase complex cytochrome b subunit
VAATPPPLLLRRPRRRPAGGGGVATAERPTAGAGVATTAATQVPPLATGPEGHTQRLLTVVKAGSIQDVKAKPTDKVHTWPHLLVGEFVASLAVTAFLLVFSAFVNAPLLTLANFNLTPNPSKAPWYFLGLQELLALFHPMVAGVTIPGIGMFALILAPYTDRNPSNKPEDRKFAISLFTIFLMFWAVLTLMGSFFRGPGFNFVFPWVDGLFFEL